METSVSPSDALLVSRLTEGNRLAFDQIYRRYAEDLFTLAFKILQDEDECTDAVQEVFVWLWQNRKDLEIRELKSYLRAAVKYRVARSIRTSRRREQILAARPPLEEAFTDDSLELKQLQALISSITEKLPPRAKEIYLLSRQQYLSNKEIAAQLQISEKTVENQLTIALRRIREGLGRMSFWILFL